MRLLHSAAWKLSCYHLISYWKGNSKTTENNTSDLDPRSQAPAIIGCKNLLSALPVQIRSSSPFMYYVGLCISCCMEAANQNIMRFAIQSTLDPSVAISYLKKLLDWHQPVMWRSSVAITASHVTTIICKVLVSNQRWATPGLPNRSPGWSFGKPPAAKEINKLMMMVMMIAFLTSCCHHKINRVVVVVVE